MQALEHLWHWTLRKSACASGRNLRSGPQGPGSAGPHSCLRGWARVRAAGGQSCVSGHPVGSRDRGEGVTSQRPSRGHWSPTWRVPAALPPHPPPVPSAGGCGHLAQGQGPGALLRSPVERSRRPGRHGREMKWERKRPPGQRQGVSGLNPASATHQLGDWGDFFFLSLLPHLSTGANLTHTAGYWGGSERWPGRLGNIRCKTQVWGWPV